MTWQGDEILFGQVKGIMRVSANGGAPEVVVGMKSEERAHGPQSLPGGQAILFTLATGSGPNMWETSQIVAQELPAGERRVLVAGGTSPRLLRSGHLLFYRDNTVFAQAFDERTVTLHGPAVPMVQKTASASFSGAGQFTVSDSGTLVYVEGSADETLNLMWIDRSGKTEMIGAPKRRYFEPRLSPDGTRIATATRDESSDIYIWDLVRGVETRVTKDEIRDVSPVWIDDRELLFANEATGSLNLNRRRADLTTERTTVAETKENEMPLAIAPDGKTVIVGVYPNNISYLARLSLDKPGVIEPLFGTSYSSNNAVISPDGHWIAYEAREGEITEVFVRPFPNVNDGRFPISQGGGTWPVWSRNGKELFYVSSRAGQADRFLLAVPITRASGNVFDWSRGVRLFNAQPYLRAGARGIDVSLDGTRFVVVAADEATTGSRSVIRYVTNWIDEVRARAK